MSYQNVGKPRFFIDNYQYLRAMGLDPESYIGDVTYPQHQKTIFNNPTAFTLDPTLAKAFVNENDTHYMKFHIPMGNQVQHMDFSGNMKWYTAVLNHDFGSKGINLQNSMFMGDIGSTAEFNDVDGNPTTIMNLESGGLCSDGTSIFYTDDNPSSDVFVNEVLISSRKYSGFQITPFDTDDYLTEVNIGAISQGVMYTMPHSPDLKLKTTIDNAGYNSITTSGGASLTNINYTGVPNWVNKGSFINPFGVGSYSENTYLDGAKRSGRRSWNLKFNYLSDNDIFSSNYMKNNYLELDGNTSDYSDNDDLNTEGNEFEYNMFTDDSFVAQVWNKTLGGALPFIFQPDSANNQPDQFFLAKFDQQSLVISQQAYKSYSISVNISEIW